MNIQITARHFKIHPTLNEQILKSSESLQHFHDGIIKTEVILSFEKVRGSLKCVELVVFIYDHTLTIMEKSEDFVKSLDIAIKKMERLLIKFKEKRNSRIRFNKQQSGV